MVWMVCIAIWLMIVAVVIVFFYGAFGPDTEAEKEQDWKDLQKYIGRRKKNAK